MLFCLVEEYRLNFLGFCTNNHKIVSSGFTAENKAIMN